MSVERCEVVVVGSGFGGSILARVLRRQERRVVLVERGAHPRFAIGESSTPLANLCLERLGRRYELPDLVRLAAYGRWLESYPELRRGLKRGFTFYAHAAGEAYSNGPDNDRRLLVAASPDDRVADSHWLREDVDRHLVERAVEEGVAYRDRTELQGLEPATGGWRLWGERRGEPFELRAALVVDASGPGGFLARRLPIESALDRPARPGLAARRPLASGHAAESGQHPLRLDTRLVFGHFAQVPDFVEVARRSGAAVEPGPYPDDRAAVHHLLEEGWMYVLPFDHGVVSAGLVLRNDAPAGESAAPGSAPEEEWHRTLERYPTLAEQFRRARPLFPIRRAERLQHQLATAAGPGWALLPHAFAFFDPLFSTGIAWSLLGVERLGLVFEALAGEGELAPRALEEAFDRYASGLRSEADQMERLLDAAWLALPDFDLFSAVSYLYFAAVSFAETAQRLEPEGRHGLAPAWQGFLGSGDPLWEPAFAEAVDRLRAIPRDRNGLATGEDRDAFLDWIRSTIAPRNVAGLADPARRNLYPVDLDLLVERAALLGKTPAEIQAALPLLRGAVAVGG